MLLCVASHLSRTSTGPRGGSVRFFGIAERILRSGHLCTFFILRGETWDCALFYFWGLTFVTTHT